MVTRISHLLFCSFILGKMLSIKGIYTNTHITTSLSSFGFYCIYSKDEILGGKNKAKFRIKKNFNL